MVINFVDMNISHYHEKEYNVFIKYNHAGHVMPYGINTHGQQWFR